MISRLRKEGRAPSGPLPSPGDLAGFDLETYLIFQKQTQRQGETFVIHVGEDKFVEPTGDAGGRLAIGVIGVAKQ